MKLLTPKSLGSLTGLFGGLGGASAAATAVDPSGVTIALCMASAIFAGMGLTGRDGIDFRTAVKDARRQLQIDLREIPMSVEQQRAVEAENDEMFAAFDACLPTHAAGMNALLADARLKPEALAVALSERLPEKSPYRSEDKIETFKTTIVQTWTALRDADRTTAFHAAFFDEFSKASAERAAMDVKLDALTEQVQSQGIGEGLSLKTARKIVRAFGLHKRSLDRDDVIMLLTQKAEEFKSLEDRLRQLSNDDPAVDSYRTEAANQLDEGEFEAALAALEKAEAIDASTIEDLEERTKARKASRAKTLGLKGDTERLRLNYRAAAEAYAEAARMVDPADDEAVFNWLNKELSMIYRLGHEYGDNAALEQAIEMATAMTRRFPRDTHPRLWAMAEGNRANTLLELGAREQGTNRLERAVAAHRAVIEVELAQGLTSGAAETQNNLGNALTTLGERESGTARLEQAVTAFTEALKERTRDRVPLEWAMTQNNLGTALQSLGVRESSTARLEKAVTAYTEALKERTRDRVPVNWAETTGNLANCKCIIAVQTGDASLAQQSVEALTEVVAFFEENDIAHHAQVTRQMLAEATDLRDRLRGGAS